MLARRQRPRQGQGLTGCGRAHDRRIATGGLAQRGASRISHFQTGSKIIVERKNAQIPRRRPHEWLTLRVEGDTSTRFNGQAKTACRKNQTVKLA